MPPFEEMDRNQRAVLWPADGSNKFGATKVGTPREIWVRWIWTESQIAGPQGVPIATSAQVHTVEELEIGGRMWLAPDHAASSDDAVEQWYGVGSAGTDSGVMEIVGYENTPDIKGRYERKGVHLAFYRDDAGEDD